MARLDYVVHVEPAHARRYGKPSLTQAGSDVPAGLGHAARVDDLEALCRLDIFDFVRFRDVPFDGLELDLCCQPCRDAYLALA